MSLRAELEQFDGKHTDVLEEILLRHRPTSSLIGKLVTLIGDTKEKTQTAATWMLKRLAEDHVPFKAEHLIALSASLSELTHWLSKLHVCQMLQ